MSDALERRFAALLGTLTKIQYTPSLESIAWHGMAWSLGLHALARRHFQLPKQGADAHLLASEALASESPEVGLPALARLIHAPGDRKEWEEWRTDEKKYEKMYYTIYTCIYIRYV